MLTIYVSCPKTFALEVKVDTSKISFGKETECLIHLCKIAKYKDGNARFTTVPLKAMSDQYKLKINVYNFENWFIFNFGFSTKKREFSEFTLKPRKTNITLILLVR